MKPEEIFPFMREKIGDPKLEIPPRSFQDMEAKFTAYQEGKLLEIEVPLYEKYGNPFGLVLGGYLPTFFDLAMGPLSFLACQKATTSLDLNTAFIAPLSCNSGFVRVQAEVINISRSYIMMEGRAFDSTGRLVAAATSRLHIF
ncbi:MAG: PaaI family thioesterase [Cellvibrionaceae bacterium]|nr:PaaI family thioesterase [Cellvibrionaceae bacterium]